MPKKNVVIGLIGTVLDLAGKRGVRKDRWRPSVSLAMQPDFPIGRYHLLYQPDYKRLADQVAMEISEASPETMVRLDPIDLANPWDFEEVYATLYDYSKQFLFKSAAEEYFVHITTGTHVAQICLFLLTESRNIPGKLVQTSRNDHLGMRGTYQIIDLDLSKYSQLKSRFQQELRGDLDFLKSGIATGNRAFNELIEMIEQVAIRSDDPILLTGPTGAGKSFLARKIFELRKKTHQIEGNFVELNCATLRGDGAMSTLFGHVKGSFTGAQQDRAGLLREANGGILFLDEIGELGIDEQAMLLRAVEEKVFLPLGSDKTTTSSFQLICGTNRDLHAAVASGKFRDDLLARINLWTFRLPGLAERREDIEPNLEYELEKQRHRTNHPLSFTPEARKRFLSFAISSEAVWIGNFRDFSAAITRMATLSQQGTIDVQHVEAEISRLKTYWKAEPVKGSANEERERLKEILGTEIVDRMDRFDLVQLLDVLEVCRESKNLSEAGRKLFETSRKDRQTSNDADRLRKYLLKFGLKWDNLRKT